MRRDPPGSTGPPPTRKHHEEEDESTSSELSLPPSAASVESARPTSSRTSSTPPLLPLSAPLPSSASWSSAWELRVRPAPLSVAARRSRSFQRLDRDLDPRDRLDRRHEARGRGVVVEGGRKDAACRSAEAVRTQTVPRPRSRQEHRDRRDDPQRDLTADARGPRVDQPPREEARSRRSRGTRSVYRVRRRLGRRRRARRKRRRRRRGRKRSGGGELRDRERGTLESERVSAVPSVDALAYTAHYDDDRDAAAETRGARERRTSARARRRWKRLEDSAEEASPRLEKRRREDVFEGLEERALPRGTEKDERRFLESERTDDPGCVEDEGKDEKCEVGGCRIRSDNTARFQKPNPRGSRGGAIAGRAWENDPGSATTGSNGPTRRLRPRIRRYGLLFIFYLLAWPLLCSTSPSEQFASGFAQNPAISYADNLTQRNGMSHLSSFSLLSSTVAHPQPQQKQQQKQQQQQHHQQQQQLQSYVQPSDHGGDGSVNHHHRRHEEEQVDASPEQRERQEEPADRSRVDQSEQREQEIDVERVDDRRRVSETAHPYNEYTWEVNQINPWLSACDLAGPAPADLQGSCGPPEVPKNCPAACVSRSTGNDDLGYLEVIQSLETRRARHEDGRNVQGRGSSVSGGEKEVVAGRGRAGGGRTAPEQCLFYLEESHKRDICRDDFGRSSSESFLTPRENRYWFVSGLRLRHCCEHAVVNALAPGKAGPLEDVLNGGRKCADALDKLLLVDALAARLHCEFEEVLARYDCAQPYSVIHNCTHCKEAYRKWVCSSLVPYFAHGGPQDLEKSEGRTGSRLRPCRSYCQSVEQRCPYLLPGDRAPAYPTQYAGEPTFLCRDPNIPETGEQAARALHSSEKDECCFHVCSEQEPELGICANCTDREARKRGRIHDPPTAPHCDLTPGQPLSTGNQYPNSPSAGPSGGTNDDGEETDWSSTAAIPTTSTSFVQQPQLPGASLCVGRSVVSLPSASSSPRASPTILLWIISILFSLLQTTPSFPTTVRLTTVLRHVPRTIETSKVHGRLKDLADFFRRLLGGSGVLRTSSKAKSRRARLGLWAGLGAVVGVRGCGFVGRPWRTRKRGTRRWWDVWGWWICGTRREFVGTVCGKLYGGHYQEFFGGHCWKVFGEFYRTILGNFFRELFWTFFGRLCRKFLRELFRAIHQGLFRNFFRGLCQKFDNELLQRFFREFPRKFFGELRQKCGRLFFRDLRQRSFKELLFRKLFQKFDRDRSPKDRPFLPRHRLLEKELLYVTPGSSGSVKRCFSNHEDRESRVSTTTRHTNASKKTSAEKPIECFHCWWWWWWRWWTPWTTSSYVVNLEVLQDLLQELFQELYEELFLKNYTSLPRHWLLEKNLQFVSPRMSGDVKRCPSNDDDREPIRKKKISGDRTVECRWWKWRWTPWTTSGYVVNLEVLQDLFQELFQELYEELFLKNYTSLPRHWLLEKNFQYVCPRMSGGVARYPSGHEDRESRREKISEGRTVQCRWWKWWWWWRWWTTCTASNYVVHRKLFHELFRELFQEIFRELFLKDYTFLPHHHQLFEKNIRYFSPRTSGDVRLNLASHDDRRSLGKNVAGGETAKCRWWTPWTTSNYAVHPKLFRELFRELFHEMFRELFLKDYTFLPHRHRLFETNIRYFSPRTPEDVKSNLANHEDPGSFRKKISGEEAAKCRWWWWHLWIPWIRTNCTVYRRTFQELFRKLCRELFQKKHRASLPRRRSFSSHEEGGSRRTLSDRVVRRCRSGCSRRRVCGAYRVTVALRLCRSSLGRASFPLDRCYVHHERASFHADAAHDLCRSKPRVDRSKFELPARVAKRRRRRGAMRGSTRKRRKTKRAARKRGRRRKRKKSGEGAAALTGDERCARSFLRKDPP